MVDPPQFRGRRWHQFGVSLLIVFAVAAGLAFAWMKTIEPYRLQREAMAAITKLGGSYKTEDATSWVRYLDKNAQDVVVVDLADCDKPDEYLPHLARLPKLRTLVVGGHQFGDEQVATLERMTRLRGVVLDSTLVTDHSTDGLKEKLPDLVVYKSERRACEELERFGAVLLDVRLYLLEIRGAKVRQPVPPLQQATPPLGLLEDITDDYFAVPAVIVQLSGKRATDADLAWMDNLAHVRVVNLNKTDISDNGVCRLAVLGRLDTLNLSHTHITDNVIPYLEKLPNLCILAIEGTDVSAQGVKRLRNALPKCDIRY